MKTVNKLFAVLMIAAVILIAFCILSTTSCQVAKANNVVNSDVINTHSTVLQDIIFEDGKPLYNGKPCVLDEGCYAIIVSILEYGVNYPMIATFTEEYNDYCYMQLN